MNRPNEESSTAGSGPKGPTGSREEKGNSATSRKHPPHLNENAEDAPLQDSQPGPEEVPTLPANAHGEDEVSTTEQAQPIDDESMYDRRPGEDKDRPPSAPDSP